MYLWIFFVILNVCQATIPLPKILNDQTLKEILQQFKMHQIMFHYDMKTQTNLDEFLVGKKTFLQPIFLINYGEADLLNISNCYSHCIQNISYARPKGYDYVHVVYLTNYLLFEKFSMVKRNVHHYDVVLFVIPENTEVLTKKWNLEGLEKAGTVIISDNKIDFYFIQFYVGNLSGIPQKIKTKGRVLNFNQYTNKFNDFNGHLFKIGYPTSNVSWFWCGIDCKAIHGVEAKLLIMLSRQLNFRFEMKAYYPDNPLGPGSWTLMVYGVHRREVDWGIGFVTTSRERLKLVDFTASLVTDGYGILYSFPSDDFLKWNCILAPFQVSLWTLCVSFLFSYTYILQKVAQIEFGSSRYGSYIECLLITFRTVVEQPFPIQPKSSVLRMLMSSWMLGVIIIDTIYIAKLLSSMTHPNIHEPNSAKELLDQDYKFLVFTQEWLVLKNYLSESADETYDKILKRCIDKFEYCDAIHKLFGNRFAMIEEGIPLQYESVTTCRNELVEKFESSLRFTSEQLFSTDYAWPFPLGSPLKVHISKIILNLHATGHLIKLFTSTYTYQIAKSNRQVIDHRPTSLQMRTIVGPIVLLALGISIAVVIFICEVVYFSYLDKTNRYN